MVIGFDASRLGVSRRTGTEHYTWELLAALGRLDRHNAYRLYTNGRPAALPPLPPNYRLHSIPFPRLWTHLRLSAEMLRAAPDILFVPAHVLPLYSPRGAVATIHDLGYVHYPQAHPPAQRLYLRLSTLWNARRATCIIADSEATARDIATYCRVSRTKITVVYLGVGERFRPVEEPGTVQTVCDRYGIRSPYLLYVGTIQPRKNLARLIEAWSRFLERRTGAAGSLVIAGKRGWMTDAIERRAQDLGIADHVRFIGYVADADLPALIGGALAYVLPSLYEGFGLPVLEAQACGTPVLTSAVSSLPEVAGDAAVLVDPLDVDAISDGIERIVEDGFLRSRLRAAGLRRSGGWTWERTARQTLAVLERAAS